VDSSNNYEKVQMPVWWNGSFRPVESSHKTTSRLKNLSKKTIAKRLLLKAGSCENCCYKHTDFGVSGSYCFCGERKLGQRAFPKEMFCNKWEVKEEKYPPIKRRYVTT